jgi:iron complex outermembrane receptor protein
MRATSRRFKLALRQGCAIHAICVAAELALLTSAASAQTPAATPAVAGPQLEQVTVTARRRTERQQRVPAAITAFSGTELKKLGVTNTNDLQRVVPDLTIGGQQRSNSQYYMRGQTPGVINQGVHNNSSVTVYFLEVPTVTSGPGTFYDMASVEVLKGPQGTLFGRNTTGGAILFTPIKPRDDYDGYLQIRGGNYNDHEIEGAANFPLVPDKLDLRVSGETARRDGFTTDVTTGEKLDDRNYDAYRVSLNMQINDELQNLLVLDGRMINQNGTSAVPVAFNPNVVLKANVIPGTNTPLTLGGTKPSIFCLEGPALFGVTTPLPGCPAGGLIGAYIAGINAKGFSYYPTSLLNQLLAQQRALGPRQIASDANFFDQERTFDATNITSWEITPDLTLKNIAGYRFNRVNQASDFDGTVLPLVRNTNTKSDWGEDALQQATDELQLQGTALATNLHYILGAYFENADPGQPTISRAEEFLPPPSYQSVPEFYQAAVAYGSVLNYHKFNDKDESVFAHGDWNLESLLNGLKLATGIRYTWDEREASIDQLNGAAQCTANTAIYTRGTTPICATRQTAEFTAPTWSVNLSDQINPNTLAYINLSRGFKSGGFNLPAPRDLAGNVYDPSFGPEYVFSTEIGLKADWHLWGAAARTNVAAFHDVYNSIQTSFASIAGGSIAAVVINAGKAHIDGLEVEQTVVPITNLSFNGYFSLLRAVYASPFSLDEGVQLEGHQLPYSPIQKYGINGTYTLPLAGKLGTLALTADYSLSTHYQTADPVDPMNYFKGNDNLNLRLDYLGIYGEPLDFAFIATNVMDRTYAVGGYPIYGLAGFRSNIYDEPRMLVGQLTLRWGPGNRW